MAPGNLLRSAQSSSASTLISTPTPHIVATPGSPLPATPDGSAAIPVSIQAASRASASTRSSSSSPSVRSRSRSPAKRGPLAATRFIPANPPAMPPAASSTAAAYVQSNVGASTSATATAATVTNADGGSSTSELSRHSHSVAQQAHQGSSNSNNKALVGSRRGTRSSRRRSVSDHIRNSKGVPVYTDADHPLAPARLAARGYHSFSCLGVPFYVNRRYRFIRELGIGAYGCVALARDLVLDCNVAIKKVTRVFERDVLARRALREVAILRHLSLCDNATVLLDFDASFVQFGEIYFVLSASEADLSQIIRSGQQLSDAHLQYFTAQILRGVRYMHSARIIHRDLKPGNLLVNADCALRLCDFGLARAFADSQRQHQQRRCSDSSRGGDDADAASTTSTTSSRSSSCKKQHPRTTADQREPRRRRIPTSRLNSPSAMDMAESLLSTASPSSSQAVDVAAAGAGAGTGAENDTLADGTELKAAAGASPKLKVRTTRLDFPGGPLTEYVATRWYRAPEIMLCFKEGYGPEIDMWSVGCILAELIGGRPIFAGKDYVDQIARINNVLGTPAPETIAKIGSARAKTYVQSLPQMPKVPFENLYPKASPEALDLLGRMLTWDPHERISAEDALQHPWLKAYHESNARWLPPEPFERFEDVEMISSFKQFQDAIVREADEMRAELAALDVEAQAVEAQQRGADEAADTLGRDFSSSVGGSDTGREQLSRRAMNASNSSTNSSADSGDTSCSGSCSNTIEEGAEDAAGARGGDTEGCESSGDSIGSQSDASEHSRQSSVVPTNGSETDGAVAGSSSTSSCSVSGRSGSRQGHAMSATTYCSSTTTPFSARSVDIDGDGDADGDSDGDGETEPTSPSVGQSTLSSFKGKAKALCLSGVDHRRHKHEHGSSSRSQLLRLMHEKDFGYGVPRSFEQMNMRRLSAALQKQQQDGKVALFRRRAMSNADPFGISGISHGCIFSGGGGHGGVRAAAAQQMPRRRLQRTGSSARLFQSDSLGDTFPTHGTDMIRRPRSDGTELALLSDDSDTEEAGGACCGDSGCGAQGGFQRASFGPQRSYNAGASAAASVSCHHSWPVVHVHFLKKSFVRLRSQQDGADQQHSRSNSTSGCSPVSTKRQSSDCTVEAEAAATATLLPVGIAARATPPGIPYAHPQPAIEPVVAA